MAYSRSRTSAPITPLLLWMDLGWKTGEMMLASAQVISRRTSMMAASGTPPSVKDQKEFTRMGQEKLDAGANAALAMATYMMRMNPNLWVRAFEQMLAVNTAMLSFAASRTLNQLSTRQQTLGRAVSQSMDTGSRLSATAARLTKRGLDPVHSKATANARRLSKR